MVGEKREPDGFERGTTRGIALRSSIFPAAAQVQPSERIPVPFNRSRFYNRCENITQPLIDHRGPTDVQQWWESSRSIWPLSLVKHR